MKTVWLVDDDASIRYVLQKALTRAGYQVESFTTAHEVLTALSTHQPDALISDVRMPEQDGMSLLETIQSHYRTLPVIIMTAHSDLDSAVQAFQKGAFEYLAKPFDLNDAINVVERAVRSQSSKTKDTTPATTTSSQRLIGEAPAMQEVFRAIGKLSVSSMSVLINGESGTGKELVASALHQHSPRKNQAFIALNMAAIPKELVESELFGHEKGAFTGANSVRKGHFEQADGGTLFLDEIGDTPLAVQTRLLRVLSDGQFYRVGAHQPIKVNVRIIAATHQHLEQLVEQGKFREDLFHRLNVIRLKLPALRERSEDIAKLCEHFLHKSAVELKTATKTLSPDAIEQLKTCYWTGNVRQLENTCRWLTVMTPSEHITAADLPQDIFTQASAPSNRHWQDAYQQWLTEQLAHTTSPIWETLQPQLEIPLIKAALKHCNGHKQQAAKKIGWGRNTLTRKLQGYNLT